MKRIRRALFLWSLCGAALAQPAVVRPYALDNTEVLDVHARELRRDYQLFVSLPASYAKSARRYPVVFVTDAGYAFPLVRAIGGSGAAKCSNTTCWAALRSGPPVD